MSEEYKRMQVKVLYSFNNNSTVFLSRSKQMHSIKIVQIPMGNDGGEIITLGAFDLKSCVSQVLKSSPENFKLQNEDYAVYYKDITEQPDEPFVANGVLSTLISTSKQHLIPGRVCQNLSANFLFGDKSNSSSHTLEIRLKLHTIARGPESQGPPQGDQQSQQLQPQQSKEKRQASYSDQVPTQPQKRSRPNNRQQPISVSASEAAIKATRTKSLPIFYPQNQQIFNIINADKSNAPSKYDNKSVQDRFKSAPFLQPKILENPSKRYNSKIVPINNKYSTVNATPGNPSSISSSSSASFNEPQRAMRTRSMVTNKQMSMIVSSPINEETDASDTDYQETNAQSELGIEDEEEDEEEVDHNSSPYTPQQPPYNPGKHQNSSQHEAQHPSSSGVQFQSLPDLEDLDSRKTHAIPHFRLPKNHDLVCMNSNCATTNSITWRYFETGYHPNYLSLHRAKVFDVKHYEGMIGPLCNACYLFLRQRGFMRPEAVVKKYMQQQRYKKDLRQKDEIQQNSEQQQMQQHQQHQHQVSGRQYASSPPVFHKFTTPSHTPSAINQVIQNNINNVNASSRPTPNYSNYNDLNDFMNQLNSFGGPLTDIDPLPQDPRQQQTLGVTPPMMATKSNTRIINLYDDGEDKENCPPPDTSDDQSHGLDSTDKQELEDFETMIVKSFSHSSDKNSSSPAHSQQHTAWMNNLFGEPTPKDQVTPRDGNTNSNQTGNFGTYETPAELKDFQEDAKSNNDETESEDESVKPHPNLPQMRTFTTTVKSSSPMISQKPMGVTNMPSSPLLTHTTDDAEDDSLDFHGNHVSEELSNHAHKMENTKGNEMSSPTTSASRINTTTSIMSYENVKAGVEQTHGSTPNTDFFSNDDVKESINVNDLTTFKHNVHQQ